jgi:hypothetical protein
VTDPTDSSDIETVGPVEVEYAEWVDRLKATYESVAFCCWHRIGDRRLGDEVSAQVVAGLVEKPKIFKYFGLPFSGRIARLAERGIEKAKAGSLVAGQGWDALIVQVNDAPLEHREVLVYGFLYDADDDELAAALRCDVDAAVERREATLCFWHEVAAASLAPHRSLRGDNQ